MIQTVFKLLISNDLKNNTHVQLLKELIIPGSYADFWKGVCDFEGFTKGVLILRPKSGGVN